MPNIEEKKTLVFTYDRPFHMSQKHSKLSMNQTEPFGKIYQQEIAYFKLWFMTTLRSTADFASALSNVNNVKITDLFEFLVMFWFSCLCSHKKINCRKLSCKIMKTSMKRSFFTFSSATFQKYI